MMQRILIATKNILKIAYQWKIAFNNPQIMRNLISWTITNTLIKDSVKLGKPWITFEAEAWLRNHLKPSFIGFKWGSGASTIYLSKRIKKLISIEHDIVWYQRMKKTLKDSRITNCEYKYIKPKVIHTATDAKYQSFYQTKNVSYKEYCLSINQYLDSTFDLVIVDGRSRNMCIEHAIFKVKDGGILVVDNSDRVEYKNGLGLLGGVESSALFWPRTI